MTINKHMQHKNKNRRFLPALVSAALVLPLAFQPLYALPDFMRKILGSSTPPLETELLKDKLGEKPQPRSSAPTYKLQPRIIVQPSTKAKTYRLTPLPTPADVPRRVIVQPAPTVPTVSRPAVPSVSTRPVPAVPQTQPIVRQPEPVRTAPVATQVRPVPPRSSLLGTQEFHMGGIKALPKWTRVLGGIANDKRAVDICHTQGRCATEKLREWQNFVKSQRGQPLKRQLENLNRYANRFPYVTDQRLWGKSDYWATPLEFLKNSGDCEDYVILKYTTLRQLGVPADNIRLVVVKDTVRNLAHAVLAVYDGPEIYILDSLFDAVLSHKQVLQYIPYYSVNENSRWAHIKKLK